MSQKDKVKELVGRSLNSYHTKALQQIERIEKKNKEQNHKINILTGELDKDYITKTAEGSVISLDHSKEGMVYLDELQGNTLVNYCTDGSKELTLNGDIDTEGTFATTTEGVDNGKVDVLCEGNTLVNLVQKGNLGWNYAGGDNTYEVIMPKSNHIKITGSNLKKDNYRYVNAGKVDTKMLKPSTEYTVCFKTLKFQGNSTIKIINGNGTNPITKGFNLTEGITKYKIVTNDEFIAEGQVLYIWINVSLDSVDIEVDSPILLEGDWTNKEVPTEFFQGMKSVGELEDNKIEILSNNGNLYKRLENSHYKVYGSTVTIIEENENGFIYKAEEWDMGLSYLISTEGLFKNKKYRLSWEGNNNTPNAPLLHSDGIKLLDSNKSFKEIISWDDFDYLEYDFKLPDSFEQGDILEIRFKNGALSVENGACNICINEIGVAKNTVISKLNKKEILLNEPLIGNSDIKDKLVKIDGKWFIERKYIKVIKEDIRFDYINSFTYGDGTIYRAERYASLPYQESSSVIFNTKFPVVTDRDFYYGTMNYGIRFNSASQYLYFREGLITSVEDANNLIPDDFIAYVELATPVYEPLEIEPTLNTYNDVTYISNNSIIPCNMKIKNSGYNVIIKPNTLYTVALDTNKSGTIGINLGGVKGTTTNNVLTLTTPATLTDDSLRLYGKGIKGSKVRLLEGNKTNWIPSHFEGMMSSFEDKFDTTDNTYKMEILMNNENLLDLSQHSINTPYTNQYKIENNTIFGTYIGDNYTDFQLWFKLKRNKTYKLSWDISSTYILNGANSQLLKGKLNGYNADSMLLNSYDVATGIISNLPCDGWYTLHFHSMRNNQFIKNLQLKLVDISTNFTERKFNKIQFSSIEPLRSVPSARDKFIFKDGKLTIERNCDVKILTGSSVGENWTIWGNSTEPNLFSAHAGNKSSNPLLPNSDVLNANNFKCDNYSVNGNVGRTEGIGWYSKNPHLTVHKSKAKNVVELKEYLRLNPITMVYKLEQPTYEEIPFELQKIILEGYENGTLFLDTNIPPTATVTYAGETPIAKSVKANKTEVSNNTADINDNILPYLMDMDYRIVMLQLENEMEDVSLARIFNGAYEMLKRDILSKRLTKEEYRHRTADYLMAGKINKEQYLELEKIIYE